MYGRKDGKKPPNQNQQSGKGKNQGGNPQQNSQKQHQGNKGQGGNRNSAPQQQSTQNQPQMHKGPGGQKGKQQHNTNQPNKNVNTPQRVQNQGNTGTFLPGNIFSQTAKAAFNLFNSQSTSATISFSLNTTNISSGFQNQASALPAGNTSNQRGGKKAAGSAVPNKSREDDTGKKSSKPTQIRIFDGNQEAEKNKGKNTKTPIFQNFKSNASHPRPSFQHRGMNRPPLLRPQFSAPRGPPQMHANQHRFAPTNFRPGIPQQNFRGNRNMFHPNNNMRQVRPMGPSYQRLPVNFSSPRFVNQHSSDGNMNAPNAMFAKQADANCFPFYQENVVDHRPKDYCQGGLEHFSAQRSIAAVSRMDNNLNSNFYEQTKAGSAGPVFQSSHQIPPGPIFKKKKRERSKAVPNQANASSWQDDSAVKSDRQKKLRQQNQKKNMRKTLFEKKSPEPEVKPLFSFQRLPAKIEIEDKDSEDDEDSVSLSRCSSDESATVSNDEDEDSFSGESEVTSEISLSSSVVPTVELDAASNSKRYSVYWDIENCPVPNNKSTVDFVKYVRDKFFNGGIETDFVAVCDVTNLKSAVANDLCRISVTTVHVSNLNKNAADRKIESYLQDFMGGKDPQYEYAIVLISGDADFSDMLHKLRYKYGVHIILICKKNTEEAFKSVAHKLIVYENLIKELPNKSKQDSIQYLIIISNFDDSFKKQVKAQVTNRLKGVNCRVKLAGNDCEVIFQTSYAQEKAHSLLKDFVLIGCQLSIRCAERLIDDTSSKGDSTEVKKSTAKVRKSNTEKSEKHKLETKENCKGAVLCVCVSSQHGDVFHWKNKFEHIWGTSAFTLKWEGSVTDGYFLVNFESLSKAQKAKKLLQTSQKSDSSAPKFLKLIKQDNVLGSFEVVSLQDLTRKKLDDNLKIIEEKKAHYLKKHDEALSDIKKMSSPSVSGAADAVASKMNEFNEQKVAFMSFTQITMQKIKQLDPNSDSIDELLNSIQRDYSRECNCISTALPIYAKKTAILKKVKKHQVVIIRAETGSGKSTQLTQYIWREQVEKHRIICTQPRKIAAITLAKHVSSQIGCSLGDIVGYQVGLSTKNSKNTGILYVTDFTMLKMLVNDDLSDVSCIIVDEAHERTVYTDLLLGMIKNCLKTRTDLKLIITSATIDTAAFLNYFNISDQCVMDISGRTFPIEDVWLNYPVTLGWDYFSKCIEITHSLLNEEAGDILVFLTTPFETEKAVKVFSEKLDKKFLKNVRVLQLHGKLDVTDQQKVFERTPKGMRKIVFATNCAETSVTIPGIKFVVDSGMVKESQYDAVRNMSVMAVNFVSQSSAEQRRGRAGRTQVGKCFRLYSHSNYDSMVKNSPPEILRVNLGQALLKLMKLGVSDPLQFDFIQSPPKDTLDSAMKQLILLKAVNLIDLSLTDLGRQMSCLPLEPRLCYMIFAGMELNVGYEAVALAALVTISRSIFFRTAENKTDADVKKLRFCQNESDYLTYLEVYKEWANVPKNAKSKWCNMNCINARSMRTAHELISELLSLLDKEADAKISARFTSEEPHDALLQIIFCSFYQNISVFTGCNRFGYRSLNVSGNLQIHPSSSLNTYGSWRPQFLIYDTILQTNQTYLINISPVPRDVVLHFIETENMQIDIESLEALQLFTYCIAPIGKTIILHDIIGKKSVKRRILEAKIKEHMQSEDVVLEFDVPKGQVKVFGPPGKDAEVESVLCLPIEEAQKRLLAEEKEFLMQSKLCIVIGAGCEVRDVILPGEFRELKVFLKESTNIDTVVEKLQTISTVTSVQEGRNHFKVTLLTPSQAEMTFNTFKNDPLFSLHKIIKDSVSDFRRNQYKLFVSFLRRACSGVAFISIDPPTALPEVLHTLSCNTVLYRNTPLQFQVSRKTQDLRVLRLPRDAETKELNALIQSYISSIAKISKCVVAREQVPQTKTEDIKSNLLQLFSEFTPLDKLSIEVQTPHSKHIRWNACVFFTNALHGETAFSILKKKSLSLSFPDLILKPELHSLLVCKLEVFTAIKDQIEEAVKFFKDNSSTDKSLDIVAVSKEGKVEIKINSNNTSDLSDARKSLLSLLLGDSIDCKGNPTLEKLFSHASQNFMLNLSKDQSKCYIDLNSRNKVITLFGSVSECNTIKLKINKYLDNLEEENFEEILLMPENARPGVLRGLLKKYGYDLGPLREECGLSSIDIDSRKHILSIKGNIESVTKCKALVESLREVLDDVIYAEEEELCPICFVKIPEEFHRLEYCGHAYCKECILHLFQNSPEFPLCCLNCGSLVVFGDLQWAINEVGRNSIEGGILKKSFSYFVDSRNDVNYCPSADCPMIFRVTTEEKIYECPACRNVVCTSCKEPFHFGMSCDLYRCCKGDSDYSLKVFLNGDPENRKKCPSCSAPIEKDGGCNHMTCWKCKCHMCWLCLQVFPDPDSVYNHQPHCPSRMSV